MKYRETLVPCQNSGMPSPKEQEQLERVNALLLDCGVLQGRAEGLADALKSSLDHDSQMRVDALGGFINRVATAATLLRQEGLHPGDQGHLL